MGSKDEIPVSYSDPFWKDAAGKAESKAGIPQGLLSSILINGERTNADRVSSAGAKTPFQIIPETRDAVLKKYGIDAYLSPQNAADAAALLLKESISRNGGDVKSAVSEYHGGTNRENWGSKTKAYSERVMNGFQADSLKKVSSDFAAWMEQNPADISKAAPVGNKSQVKVDPVLNAEFGQWLAGQNGSAVQKIPGMDYVAPEKPVRQVSALESVAGPIEAAISTATGLTGGTLGLAAGSIAGIGKSIADGTFGTQQGADAAQKTAEEMAAALTYNPRTQTGLQLAENVGSLLTQAIPLGLVAPELGALKTLAKPSVMQAVEGARDLKSTATQAAMQGYNGVRGGLEGLTPGSPQVPAASPSVGAQGAFSHGQGSGGRTLSAGAALPEDIARSTAAEISPEMQTEVENALRKRGGVNQQALENHKKALELSSPVKLTAGQAAEDPILISEERNSRRSNPEFIERADENNKSLIESLSAIKDSSAENVFYQTAAEHGQHLIDSYKTADRAARNEIRQAYQALDDANGGKFPIDTQQFLKDADANLEKKNRRWFVPSQVESVLSEYRKGKDMDFNGFEELRTILAQEARTAERAGNGNIATAVSSIRDALENLPLSSEAEGVKALANRARELAKERFDRIKADKAYSAVLAGKAVPETFISRFVTSSGVGNDALLTTLKHLENNDPVSKQVVASALIKHLQSAANVTDMSGTFAAAKFNKAIESLGGKLETALGMDDAAIAKKIGEVARLLSQQPTGSYVNNSGTAVQLALSAADKIPGIRAAKAVVENAINSKKVADSLRVGAGIGQKESALLRVREKVQNAAKSKSR